jgi:hypothetical protein
MTDERNWIGKPRSKDTPYPGDMTGQPTMGMATTTLTRPRNGAAFLAGATAGALVGFTIGAASAVAGIALLRLLTS